MIRGLFTTVALLVLIQFSHQQITLMVEKPEIVKTVLKQGTKAKVIMWGKHDTMDDLTTEAKLADPKHGCSPYVNVDSTDPSQYAYLIKFGGKCSLSTQIHNAQVAGAIALIIQNPSNKLDQIQVPDHMSGVHIPVLIIGKKDAGIIMDAANDSQFDYKVTITLRFKDFIFNSKEAIKLDLYYSPDEYQGTKFLGQFAETRFVHDLNEGNIEFKRHHVILHCKYCKDKHYATMKENCLSGGRYCALSNRGKITGENILIQDLYNICVENIIEKDPKLTTFDLMGYYYNYDKTCAEKMHLSCTRAILEKMKIDAIAKKCVEESIEVKGTKPRIFLDDNKLLRQEKEDFKKVENFDRFPLLKINNIIYYGPLQVENVFAFICKHVKSNLKGCSRYIREVDGKANNFFTISVMVLVAIAFCWLLNKCKTQLRIRFDKQLNLQVDQSINKFLERTGGSTL